MQKYITLLFIVLTSPFGFGQTTKKMSFQEIYNLTLASDTFVINQGIADFGFVEAKNKFYTFENNKNQIFEIDTTYLFPEEYLKLDAPVYRYKYLKSRNGELLNTLVFVFDIKNFYEYFHDAIKIIEDSKSGNCIWTYNIENKDKPEKEIIYFHVWGNQKAKKYVRADFYLLENKFVLTTDLLIRK